MMKKQYTKPSLAVEFFALTQTVSSCTGLKINAVDTMCVLSDPNSTNTMLNWAYHNGFLNQCEKNLTGDWYDSVCYHTSINAAFSS